MSEVKPTNNETLTADHKAANETQKHTEGEEAVKEKKTPAKVEPAEVKKAEDTKPLKDHKEKKVIVEEAKDDGDDDDINLEDLDEDDLEELEKII